MSVNFPPVICTRIDSACVAALTHHFFEEDNPPDGGRPFLILIHILGIIREAQEDPSIVCKGQSSLHVLDDWDAVSDTFSLLFDSPSLYCPPP